MTPYPPRGSTNEHDVCCHNSDLPTTPMPKVTETGTQYHLQEKVTHLNLADYLYDLKAIAKETSKLHNLKINYIMNYENRGRVRYELH